MARPPWRGLPVAAPWFAIDEVEPEVYRFTEPHCHRLVRANGYLVKGETRDLLIDTGMGIADLRAALGALLNKPLVVFTTHAHVDHIGGHSAFQGCEILVHPAEAAALRNADFPPGLGFDHFEPRLRSALEAQGFDMAGLMIDAVPTPGYDPALYRCEGTTPTRLVREGDIVDLGTRRLAVLHLPGHSPGGVGLWDAAANLLFSGDTLYDGVLIDEIEGADIRSYVASLRRLRDFPAARVLGGHKDAFGADRMIEIIDDYLARRASATRT